MFFVVFILFLSSVREWNSLQEFSCGMDGSSCVTFLGKRIMGNCCMVGAWLSMLENCESISPERFRVGMFDEFVVATRSLLAMIESGKVVSEGSDWACSRMKAVLGYMRYLVDECGETIDESERCSLRKVLVGLEVSVCHVSCFL